MSAPAAGAGWKRYVHNGQPQTGVEVKHKAACETKSQGCKCKPRYRVSVPAGESGKRLWSYGATLSEARSNVEIAKAEKKERARRGRVGDLTVKEAIECYRADLDKGLIRSIGKVNARKPLRPRTVQDRKRDLVILEKGLPAATVDGVDVAMVEGLGKMRVSDVRHPDVIRLLEGVRKLQSASSTNQVRAAITCLYHRLGELDADFEPRLDLKRVPRCIVERRNLDGFSALETHQLIEALAPREKAAYALAAYAGLRISETLGLRIERIDFALRRLDVQWAWDDKNRALGPAKSRAGERYTIMVDRLAAALRPLVEGRDPGEFLFLNPHTGQPYCGDTIRNSARRQWTETTGMLPHEARHRAASMWNASGIDDTTRIRMAGHASPRITDFYTHQVSEGFEQNRLKLEAFLDGVGTAESTTQPAETGEAAIRRRLSEIAGEMTILTEMLSRAAVPTEI